MNKREKILAAATGLVAVSFITYLAINRVFLLPAAQRFSRAADLVRRVDQARAERARETEYRARLRELAGRTFGDDELQVSEKIRARITALLAQSGLSAERLTLKPLAGARVPGVYKEVGWMVQVRGSQPRVVDFLYLMTREPHLHRLDNLVVTPIRGSTEVEVQVKYGTLVLEPPKGEKLQTAAVSGELDPNLLEAPERKAYEVVASRDLFRPYIPAPKPEPTAPTPRPEAPAPPRPPEVPVGRYRLVGLPNWGGQPEVLVRDSSSGNVARYKTGDELAGGTIVAVDYRPMPMPNKPEILSGSRVVIRAGSQYHAVELGRYLTEKYALSPDQVPPGLPKLDEAAPPAGGSPPAAGP